MLALQECPLRGEDNGLFKSGEGWPEGYEGIAGDLSDSCLGFQIIKKGRFKTGLFEVIIFYHQTEAIFLLPVARSS